MKAIAAVAIASNFNKGELAAAGIFVGLSIFVFSATGLLQWLSRVVPIPVVKGIQVGAGLSLVISAGGKLISGLSWVEPSWADNYFWVIITFVGLLVTSVYRRVPYGLVLFVLGLVFAFVRLATTSIHSRLPSLAIWHPGFVVPKGPQWTVGIFDAGIGQIPLTTLNSIIAVVHLSSDLLPDVETPKTTSIGISVAAMNLIGCWFKAMPVCHGSGGLAAQYRFGARSGASIIFLGIFKIVLGIFFGNSLVDLLKHFPAAFLGIMVIAAGLELASVGESLNTGRSWDLGGSSGPGHSQSWSEATLSEEERKRRWTVMIVTVGLLVAFKNDGIGFVAGMLCHWSYRLPLLVNKVHGKFTEGRIRLGRGSN